ncbi:MAG: nitroreductase family deazaflavin-dependent oxidoreductase [Pseudolysinimonas sp.]
MTIVARLREWNAEWLRSMYRGRHGDRRARGFATFWSRVFGWGLFSHRWVSLEVPGWRSGKLTRVPLGMAHVQHNWYLVSMLGECNWVRNVRGAGGRATLRHGSARDVDLIEVRASGRSAIIKAYLAQVPGARPHIPVDRHRPVRDFDSIASGFPVFRVTDHPVG